MGGTLRSWAVPKNLPARQGVKRLAIATPNHPLDYIDFEGAIPPGQYGAGTVAIWDAGEYMLHAQRKSSLLFDLRGRRLRGRYLMVHMRDTQWLISKKRGSGNG